jgi:hypothetical protein
MIVIKVNYSNRSFSINKPVFRIKAWTNSILIPLFIATDVGEGAYTRGQDPDEEDSREVAETHGDARQTARAGCQRTHLIV